MLDKEFCNPDNYSVIIPYRDLVEIVEMAKNYKAILATVKRSEEQNAAMRSMFSECLEVVREIREFVRDT